VGDFTSLSTAFFLFSFRAPAAVPGTADLLLEALMREGKKQGHARLNLGLGINNGIEAFKGKWGATPFLACVETSWDLPRQPGFFRRLLGR
jgi:hypothetical protein